jgi:hypothetical protein
MIPLRALLAFQSLKVFLVKDVINYYSSDFTREILTFQTYHNYIIEYFYITCFLASAILIFTRDVYEMKDEKIQRINKNDCLKIFLVVFTLIFTKDIENAI